MKRSLLTLIVVGSLLAGCASDHHGSGGLFPVGIYAEHLQSTHQNEVGGVRSLAEHLALRAPWEWQSYSEHFAPDRVGGLPAIWGGTISLFTSSEDASALAAYGFHLK